MTLQTASAGLTSRYRSVVLATLVSFVVGPLLASTNAKPSAAPSPRAPLPALQDPPPTAASAAAPNAGKDEKWVYAQLSKADQLMRQGQVEPARAALKAVLAKHKDARALVLMARSYLCFPPTSPAEALKILKPLLTTNAKYVDGYLEWARALRENRDYENALVTYDRLLKFAPKELRAYYGKVDTFLVQKKFLDADKVARAALALDPRAPEAYYYVGKVQDRRTDRRYNHADAATAYRHAVDLSHGQGRYYAALLFCQAMYLQVGYDQTLAELKAKSPGDANVAFGEGLVLDKRLRLVEALAKFEGAATTNWNLTFAHFAAGVLHAGKSLSQIALARNTRPMGKGATYPGRDIPKAVAHMAMVKFQDPTFPLMAVVDEVMQEYQSSPVPDDVTPEEAEQRKAYLQYMHRLNALH